MKARDKNRLEQIRTLYLNGKTQQEIGDIYGVSAQRIYQILSENVEDYPAYKHMRKGKALDRCYKTILNYKIENDGTSPSIFYIGEKLGIGAESVHAYLHTLVKQKKIVWGEGSKSGIKVRGGQWIPPRGER